MLNVPGHGVSSKEERIDATCPEYKFYKVTENLHIGNNGHQLLSLQWSKETTSLARKVTEEYLLLSCYQY